MEAARNQVYRFRLNEAELTALQLVAEHDRRKPPETLRELIRAAARACGFWPPPEVREFERKKSEG